MQENGLVIVFTTKFLTNVYLEEEFHLVLIA